ncbi:hypothetical protein BTM25_07080 [Actinomadura rubteroloni]|uniref:Guanylate cyclase domain-containing protein n=1 Tax=Actinomadura rubteroloni TaxID=1926885 RepID=A0A2P4UMN7_9ACTN|nr:hypothetical protein [Actinomadura rubteroloni]POM26312.1 hypothetical protein BTM25_07080 [Actinomadura rubteroloni]
MESLRALLVVDAEKFSRHPGSELPGLHLAIVDAVDRACAGSGLKEIWERVRFRQSTGDGLLSALPVEALPRLVHPFPHRLQEALAAAAPGLRARGVRLRLRVALHFGFVDDERTDAPGISTATTDVNRLLDSGPLRDALESSDPDVTFAAVLLSDEAFRTFVLDGKTDLKPSQFTEVRVVVKTFDRPAHLYVPTPSRRAAGPSDAEPEPEPAPSPPRPSLGNVQVSGDGSQNIVGSVLNGDAHLHGRA